MQQEFKMAIMGSPDAVIGFRAVGIDAYPVTEKQVAAETIQQLHSSSDYAVVFVTEDWMDRITDIVDELPPRALPAIVAVPSHAGSTGAGLAQLKKVVEQAVGSDILSDD